MSKLKVLIAGHGGQGILLLGDYIAYAAMLDGKHVAYTPSYGPETRGGKAKCYVITSDEDVDNPIAEEPDVEIIMNQPSMDFVNYIRPQGLVIYNSSLVTTEVDWDDIRMVAVPATGIADQLRHDFSNEAQDTKIFANAVMFGAFLELCAPSIGEERINQMLKYFLAGKKEALISLNTLAITRGREYVSANPPLNTGAGRRFRYVPSWALQ